jgi:hypothetical protein
VLSRNDVPGTLSGISPTSKARSRPEQRRWHDRDAVASAVGRGPGGDDHGVEQVGTELVAQPVQVAHVLVGV